MKKRFIRRPWSCVASLSWGNLGHGHRSSPAQGQTFRGPWPYVRQVFLEGIFVHCLCLSQKSSIAGKIPLFHPNPLQNRKFNFIVVSRALSITSGRGRKADYVNHDHTLSCTCAISVKISWVSTLVGVFVGTPCTIQHKEMRASWTFSWACSRTLSLHKYFPEHFHGSSFAFASSVNPKKNRISLTSGSPSEVIFLQIWYIPWLFVLCALSVKLLQARWEVFTENSVVEAQYDLRSARLLWQSHPFLWQSYPFILRTLEPVSAIWITFLEIQCYIGNSTSCIWWEDCL